MWVWDRVSNGANNSKDALVLALAVGLGQAQMCLGFEQAQMRLGPASGLGPGRGPGPVFNWGRGPGPKFDPHWALALADAEC